MIKSILIFLAVCFSAPFVKAQCYNDSVCPHLVFARLIDTSWCMNGQVELFAPAVCPEENPTSCPGTWLLDSIVWNLGNGSEITTNQYSSLVYQYNISDTLSISAVGYTTNAYGDQCENSLVWILNPLANPCLSFNADTTLYSSALSIQPF